MLQLDTDGLGSYFTPHNFPGRRVAKGFLRALSLQSGEELSPGNVNKEGDIIWQSWCSACPGSVSSMVIAFLIFY